MSVLIKDMELPTSCTMCWLNTFCGVWNTEPVKHKGFNDRLEDCPLTELIQCKDCKYWNGVGKFCDHEMIALEEDYCSWAKRRGEE